MSASVDLAGGLILKGAPSQPTNFGLVIDMKTAKALGLTIRTSATSRI